MHSRIFQVSENSIPTEDYISDAELIDHWFLYSVADYVNDATDRDEDIEWLKSIYNGKGLAFGIDEGGEYVIIVDKTLYFQNAFFAFQNTLNVLQSTTLEEFISSKKGMAMYQLNEAYDDKYGFYVNVDGYMQTLDNFVRESSNGKKYYIGATIDYHY